MAAKRYETIAMFTNGALTYHVSANEKAAWNLGRTWLLRGIEETERGFIIAPSLIKEIHVREHDPVRWEPKPAGDAETPSPVDTEVKPAASN